MAHNFVFGALVCVSEQFLNDISAQYRLTDAIQFKVEQKQEFILTVTSKTNQLQQERQDYIQLYK